MDEPSAAISIDDRSGVPFYRQIIDKILQRIATGELAPGDRLPTVRQLSIDAQLNPNTVARAYRELEIRNVIETQRGTGSFVAANPGVTGDAAERRKYLEAFCDAVVADAGKNGFALHEVVDALADRIPDRR